jgi:hypothetical protein
MISVKQVKGMDRLCFTAPVQINESVGFLGSSVLDNFSRNTARSEIQLGIENIPFVGFYLAGTRDCFHNAPA